MVEVRRITYQEIKPWILQKHYARRMPSVSYAFGCFIDGELVGVVSYGSPASRTLCMGICGKENTDKVIELNRLVIESDQKNLASLLVGRSMKLLPKPKIVVSFADTGQGHIGYVYQATNFIYTGLTKARTDLDTGNKHHRHYDKNADYSKRKIRHQKHRYVYFVGCDKATKQSLKYPVEPYPKGESKRYDTGEKLSVQGVLL